MAEGFFEYWKQFWERDNSTMTRDHWIEAMQHVESVDRFDTFDIDITVDDLMQSINTTPSRSARGLCGWSIKEVKTFPPKIIEYLKRALDVFLMKGWPEIFSLVKVALPPKVSSPCQPKDGRPIAIMSQIYRILTKPIAKKILMYFADRMPRSIAGGLPGRDTMDIWYTIQHCVENSIHKQQHLYGFCLDIQKCFNAIGRYPATQAMIRLGVPPTIVDMWFRLLGQLKRSVCIAGSSSSFHPSTTGIPEGDPMSVPCMVSICYIWHQYIQRTGLSEPWSFADNWEITSNSMIHLTQSIQDIMSFLQAWKLKADIGKSWCWSTKKLTSDEAHVLKETCSTIGDIPVVSSQKDLGAQMKYKRTQMLGSIKERFDKATLRAQRLMSIPTTLEQKWRALKLGVSSVALYGIEIASIGWSHFQKLRSCFADVLAEGRGNRNEWLACHLTNASNGDPETAAIQRCFRAIRRFLVFYPQYASDFRELLKHASPETVSACGPASALKRWLVRLAWKVLPSGNVITDNQIVIDLFTTPLEFIYQQISSSWTQKVLCEISHRQGLCDIPTPNPVATLSSIAHYDEVDKKISIKHIMGAYTCANKARHWQDHDGSCCFCQSGKTDSMSHRVFDCTFFDGIRHPYKSLLEEVQRLYPYWAFSPTIPTHPDEVRLLQICSLFPVSLLQDETNCYSDPSTIYTFYTDGSCSFPDCPSASLASWSVVGDDLHDDCKRCELGKLYQDNNEWPTTLKSIASGHVPNKQTNDRGGLMAVIRCLSLAKHRVCIWSDSTYALDTLSKVIESKGDITKLHKCKNWDLVILLISVVNLRTEEEIRFNHIKAHEPLNLPRHPIVQYNVLGNYLADSIASNLIQNLPDDLKMISTGINEHYSAVKTLHKGYMDFACKLTKTLPKNDFCEEREALTSHENKIDAKAWQISGETHSYTCDVANSVYSTIPHPPYFASAVVVWLRSLKWPQTQHANDIGVTWLELLTDLCISTACFPPVTQGKWKGQYVYTEVFKGSASSLLENPVKDQIAALRSCIKAIAAIHGEAIFPMSFFTKDCKSLLIHPGGRQMSGLTIRPILANPVATANTMESLHMSMKRGGTNTVPSSITINRNHPCLSVVAPNSVPNCQSRITCFKQAKERLRR